MLEVRGSIYKSFRKQMKETLGVTGRALDAICAKLHLIAIESMERIWKYRQARLNTTKHHSSKQPGTKRPGLDRDLDPASGLLDQAMSVCEGGPVP